MRSFVYSAGLAVLALVLYCEHETIAQAGKGRQYYSPTWKYQASGDYHYKTYHYKAKPADTTYKHQVVVYKPKVTKNYVHWYNPETKKYWARCPTVHHEKYGEEVKAGKDYWSIVPKEKRHESLHEVKEEDYGAVTDQSPYVPEATDKVKIACPPSDLPKE